MICACRAKKEEMDYEPGKRIAQTFVILSGIDKEKYSGSEYEIKDIAVHELTVFLSITEDQTVLCYRNSCPIAYNSLPKEKKESLLSCVAILNSLTLRGNWSLEKLEIDHPEEKDLEFIMFKTTWEKTCSPE